MARMEEHSPATLAADLPDHGPCQGDFGHIVFVYGDYEAYELEVHFADGYTVAVVTMEADQVRPATRRDVLCVRRLSA